MDWWRPAEPEKVLCFATLAYTEGYISLSEFEKILNGTTEDSGHALLCAATNRYTSIDDTLLMKLVDLAGVRLKSHAMIKEIYHDLVKRGKHEHAKKIQMYIDEATT